MREDFGEKVATVAVVIVLGIIIAMIFALVFALPTMMLWNRLVPDLFGLPPISFYQALGLCLLTRFLFGTGKSSSGKAT